MHLGTASALITARAVLRNAGWGALGLQWPANARPPPHRTTDRTQPRAIHALGLQLRDYVADIQL
ncbi:hypothetical protein XOC_2281 [Xanthomonas oryzae pv. oryzicola BLS256]|uniref:Uncharacterized protein n=1 Tax=Xanthomonas oryzae pv. oryzicola (strain BLS256) TaxID=383407 RepID=G7TEQ3_XANOB|nr:hypothetical protein XOC_2281 [Xanthomonas oryzae pv. oryzicola BLS256]